MRRIHLLRLGLLAGALVPALAAAQAYRWTDEKGRVHYGDKPPAGAASRPVENRISSITGPATVSRTAAAKKPGAASVTLYSTSWCRYCRQAREHFARRGVPFDERDIERSPTWKREYDGLGGRGVPLILVGSQRMDGYDAGSLETLLRNEGL